MSIKKVLSYIYPFTKKYNSDINGTLEVTTYNGRKILDTKNANYSYGSVHRIFRSCISKVNLNDVENTLLLGLGAGSVVDLLRNEFGYKGAITAIELDEQIIRIAKTEFNVESFGALTIIQGDAFEKVKTLREAYDLIVVDIFIDNSIPQQLYQLDFWEAIHHHVADKGIIIFNTIKETTKSLQPVLDFLEHSGYISHHLKSVDRINSVFIWKLDLLQKK